MGWLVGGLVEALVAYLCKLIGSLMGWVTEAFKDVLGADPTVFLEMFPITKDLQVAFKTIGFCLCIGLVMFGCVRNMLSGLGFAGENPFKMVCRFFAAVVLIFTLPDIMNFFYTTTNGEDGLFKTIYDEVYEINGGTASTFGSGFFDIIGDSTNIVTGGISKVVVSVVLLILITVIGINFLKLLVEMFERYLLLNILIFFSPLSASAITLESTMKIFSSYMKMFIGQLVMLLMNLVSVKIIQNGFSMAASVIGGGTQLTGVSATFMPFIALMLVIAMLKVLQRVDNYARDIGLTVGVTGGSLLDEIVGTSAMFKPVMGALTGGLIGGKKGGGSGGGAGAAGSDGGALGKMARSSPVGKAFMGLSSIKDGLNQAKKATGMSNANALDMIKFYANNGGTKAFKNEFSKGIKDGLTSKMGVSSTATSNVANAVLGKVAPDMQAKMNEGMSGQIRSMMNSSVPIKGYNANARSTQMGFQNFASNLSPADDFVAPSVGISDLSDVSVGNGGALGTNANGDLISFSTYQPADTDSRYTAEYKDSDGNNYWVQNLSRANDISMANNNGREYTTYSKAQKALNTGSTNYDFEGKANRNDVVSDFPSGSAEKASSENSSKKKS